MKRYRMIGSFLLGISAWSSTQSADNPALITKLFHHKVPNMDRSLEMGSVVLYLTKKPAITVTTKMEGARKQTIYFIPNVRMKSDLNGIAQQMKQETDRPYSIAIKEVTDPRQGLQIMFTYNPHNVGISYELFNSITLQNGLVFRLFNKKVISRIQASGSPIIQTAANAPRVVIDCGHGGSDMGAVGCNNIREKEVNLQVGLQVAQLLSDHKIAVDLVRRSDQTCLLDERTTFANQKDARLFVSIHSNAARDTSMSGIETYCLSPALFSFGDTSLAPDEYSFVSAQLKSKYAQSSTLAHTIHSSLLKSVCSYQPADRHVKQSVAQVLLGTTIPAVLIELGFLTHQKESSLLVQKQYQSCLARGIVSGIVSYLAHA